jgi:transposase
MGLSKKQERDYAKMLYVSERLSKKEIAERVKVTEKTLSRWIDQEDWDALRKSLLTTKQHQISMLYDQLDCLNQDIATRDIKVATVKEADVIIKLSSAIQRLEVETSLGQIVEVARAFIPFVREQDVAQAQIITKFFDVFIQSKLK